MPLPTTKTKPKSDFTAFTTLIYGAPKIGKSTLASQFDNPLFLATEAGLNAIEAYQQNIDSWEQFLLTCKELAEGKHEFKTIVIDTVDNLFKFCSNYVCTKNKITHESELEWGKGWKLVKEEFFRAITKLSHLPYGLVIISHADPTEIKTRTGSITRWNPTMAKQAWEIVEPLVDFIFYASVATTKEGEERILHCRSSENWNAGTRFKDWSETLPISYAAIKNEFDRVTKLEGENK